MAQMRRISTDDMRQFDDNRRSGYFKHTPQPYADLGELVAGQKPGRQEPAERTLAINLGLAMDDLAVAPEIYRRARQKGLGVWLAL
jgi:ornithine cyclodeaminase/alanine dehydrogenase-like protein (mu-crystallin family)